MFTGTFVPGTDGAPQRQGTTTATQGQGLFQHQRTGHHCSEGAAVVLKRRQVRQGVAPVANNVLHCVLVHGTSVSQMYCWASKHFYLSQGRRLIKASSRAGGGQGNERSASCTATGEMAAPPLFITKVRRCQKHCPSLEHFYGAPPPQHQRCLFRHHHHHRHHHCHRRRRRRRLAL